jgi:hypothetical protein
MYNGSTIKLSTNRGRIIFAWIWGLTGITFKLFVCYSYIFFLILKADESGE